MKISLIVIIFISFFNLFSLNGQLKGKVYVGTFDGAEVIYCFDSVTVKINFKMNLPENDFTILYPYLITGDTLIIENNYFRIKKNINKLKEMRSPVKSYKDKLFLFDESNSYHKWLMNNIKQNNL